MTDEQQNSSAQSKLCADAQEHSPQAQRSGGKWTPGPWKICGERDGRLPGDWDRIVSAITYDTVAAIRNPMNVMATIKDPAAELANAHLIAASPAMFEALKAVETSSATRLLHAVRKQVRAALASAEGREP